MGQEKYFEKNQKTKSFNHNPNWEIHSREGAKELCKQILKYTIRDFESLPKENTLHITASIALTSPNYLDLFLSFCPEMEGEINRARELAYAEKLEESLKKLKADLSNIKVAMKFLSNKQNALQKEWES